MTKHQDQACQTDLIGFQIDFIFEQLNLKSINTKNNDLTSFKRETSPNLKMNQNFNQNPEIVQKEDQSESRVLNQIEEEYSQSKTKYLNHMLENFHRITSRISRERRDLHGTGFLNKIGSNFLNQTEDKKLAFRKKSFMESSKRVSSPKFNKSRRTSQKNLNSERIYQDEESDRVLCQLEEEFSLSRTKYFTKMLENFHRKTNLISKEKKEKHGTASFMSKIGTRSQHQSEDQKHKRTMNFQETYSQFRQKLQTEKKNRKNTPDINFNYSQNKKYTTQDSNQRSYQV